MVKEISIWDGLTKPEHWETAACGWGLIGIVFAIPVLLTSNKFAMVLLKRKWKHIQSLTYLFFVFGGIHIALIEDGEGFIAIGAVAVLWLLAKFKFQLSVANLKFPKFNK